MSGSMLSSAASGTFVPKVTRELTLALNCSTSSQWVKECLQGKSIEEIFDGIEKIGPAYIAEPRPKFGPNRMDRELFPMDHPEAIEKLPPKRTMLGFAELDFLKMALIDGNSSVYALGLTDSQMENYGQADFEAFLRDHVAKSDYFGEEMARDVLAELLDFYVNKYDEGVEEAQRDTPFFLRLYAMVCSDLMIVVPMLWECQISAGANWPVYLYEYKYANPDVFPKREKVHVAYHGYDHSLLFGEALVRNEADRAISAFLIDSIVNFVKNGDPSSAAVKWEPTGNFSLTDSRSISHMEIGAQPAQKEGMGGELRRLRFWMGIRQKYGAAFDSIRGIYGGNGANGGGGGRMAWLSLAFILLLAMMAKTF